jgi:hypothetical protein
MAAALGKRKEARHYAEMAENVRDSLVRNHVRDGGTVSGNEQSSYALVLGMDHLRGDLREKAEERLLEAIHDYEEHLATGSITTIFLLKYLADNGHQDLAYQMVMQPACPSYGFMVDSGATATWERFDSWHPQLGFNPHYMNAFNHLGMNSVFEWIFGYVAGIRPDPEHPGYERFIIAPCLESGPEWVRSSYASVRGRITCNWQRNDASVKLEVTVPPNTRAEVRIPAANAGDVLEAGEPAEEARGIKALGCDDGIAVFEVGSGNYGFVSAVK